MADFKNKSNFSSKPNVESKTFQFLYEQIIADLLRDIKNLITRERKMPSTLKAIYDSLRTLAHLLGCDEETIDAVQDDWNETFKGNLKHPAILSRAIDFNIEFLRQLVDVMMDKNMIFKTSWVAELESWNFWDEEKNGNKDENKDKS